MTQANNKVAPTPARNWLKILTKYRQPNPLRSLLELIVTVVVFIALWVAAWAALPVSYWLTLLISLPAGAFLVRFFLIQHDCGHYAFFRSRAVNDWVGRFLGVFTMTPYEVWRSDHAIHHSTTGNLSKRGTGDIDTLTIREYEARTPGHRLAYRLYRHPLVMFGIGPAYNFLLRNRIPTGLFKASKKYWISAMGTNIVVALVIGGMMILVGVGPFLLVQLPITIFAASIGVWMFYVQHQFEDTYWSAHEEWQLPEAALFGSSFYDLPEPLSWLTGHIGIHHVHHLNSRIPYYRLPEVLKNHVELKGVRHLSLTDSFACLKLRLWDEDQRKLVPFPQG
jgi:omega-6 fatty acid desaturase (delta-12 desaturase)